MRDAFYGIGGIGALIYFLQQADSAVQIIFAFPKAIVWPGFVVYALMQSLGM